jgi:transcriptional regulator with XRE-family HTH domain
MIHQPELGKKISDYRKDRGLTQEDLVQKCNLSVRTLQRIEAGEVNPRAFTVRLIFEALDLSYDHSLKSMNGDDKGLLQQFYINFIDLFNLKTNVMKKVSILSMVLFAIVFSIFSLASESEAQSVSKAESIIEQNNANFKKWFNSGDIDSLVELYRDDACLVSRGCGKDYIRNYYNFESGRFKFSELSITSISVSDTIAVEKGKWRAMLSSGETIGGEYLSEWRYKDKKWLIVSESSGLSID